MSEQTGPAWEWSRPTEEKKRELEVIRDRLRTAGVEPGPDGFDTDTLIRAIEQQGHEWKFEPDDDCYRAEVRRHFFPTQSVLIVSHGWAPEVALARSLDEAMRSSPSDIA